MPTSPENQAKQDPKRRKEYKKLQKQKRPKNGDEPAGAEGAKNRGKAKAEKKAKRQRYRLFPIWLRIIVVLVLCGLALILGLMFGYGVIGDGKATEALELDTWRHIKNIVIGEG